MTAYIIAARRTAVAPRRGAFANIEAHDLAAPVLRACLDDAGLAPGRVNQVILGNALSGGGNVARLASLAAGLPDSVPALTVDTQCCSGLDAIILAARLIEAGAAQAVLAGGVESWSCAPLRAVRPRAAGEAPVFYDRPPFAPTPERDPDMLEAMAALALRENCSRFNQSNTSANSHRKALAARERMKQEIVPLGGLDHDAFTRDMNIRLSLRAPIVAGEGRYAIDATGVAVEADAAAVVLVVSEELRDELNLLGCEVMGAASAGSPPEEPFAAMVPAASQACPDELIDEFDEIAVFELMESTSVQIASNLHALRIDPNRVNVGGGALARGHPIGASGAILAVRLFQELMGWPSVVEVPVFPDTPHRYRPQMPAYPFGLAAIAAAGGLGSALLLRRS